MVYIWAAGFHLIYGEEEVCWKLGGKFLKIFFRSVKICFGAFSNVQKGLSWLNTYLFDRRHLVVRNSKKQAQRRAVPGAVFSHLMLEMDFNYFRRFSLEKIH